jgi:hypothetical protein
MAADISVVIGELVKDHLGHIALKAKHLAIDIGEPVREPLLLLQLEGNFGDSKFARFQRLSVSIGRILTSAGDGRDFISSQKHCHSLPPASSRISAEPGLDQIWLHLGINSSL